ncbi:hypothetical protein DFA_06832 [Cavenderia fasciculata]|uniref:Uncharacterized protein n=1 Tax=Cavenderia fasciculata TaxID=261658 RepID=F4Q2E5_CACFS|nr:uncharacterized protein DFA_06832 [Cavenderia fasciculata]EGG18165.1 hypothetical protein DFA_06832 [Cavenderia fasciculata]|eukprot:XP_004366206.1 hypothetical protein DFA_06832 [Cavenderia fasciculata]
MSHQTQSRSFIHSTVVHLSIYLSLKEKMKALILLSLLSSVMSVTIIMAQPEVIYTESTIQKNFVVMSVYANSACSVGGTPTGLPEKIVSFMPNTCYNYPTFSVNVSVSTTNQYSYQFYTLLGCYPQSASSIAIPTMPSKCIITDNTGTTPSPPWMTFYLGPPPIPTLTGLSSSLYYERLSTTISTCNITNINNYQNQRVVILPNTCTFSDMRSGSIKSLDGTASSIQLDTNCAGGSPVTYQSQCPPTLDGQRIMSAFKNGLISTSNPIPSVTSYTTVGVSNLNFGYPLGTTIFANVTWLSSNGSSWNQQPGYIYKMSDQMYFPSPHVNFTGYLLFVQNGLNYVLNKPNSIEFKTSQFHIPPYPKMKSISTTLITTRKIEFNYQSEGGFVGQNLYGIVVVVFPGGVVGGVYDQSTCPPVGCVLNDLPAGSGISIKVTVNNTFATNLMQKDVMLALPIETFDFTLTIVSDTVEIGFVYLGYGYGPSTSGLLIESNGVKLVDISSILTASYIYSYSSTTPTIFTVTCNGTNDGTTLNAPSQQFISKGDFKLNNVTIEWVGLTRAMVSFGAEGLNPNYTLYIDSMDGSSWTEKNSLQYLITPLVASTYYQFEAYIEDTVTTLRTDSIIFNLTTVVSYPPITNFTITPFQ